MGIRNNNAEAMETITRTMTIQATKVVLMEFVITAKRLDIRKHIDIRNRVINNQILMELVITATSLGISKKLATRNKGMNKQILQRTKK